MSTMSVTLPGSRVPILVELSNVRRVHEHVVGVPTAASD